jgi:RNA polymerase sigma factor (sigma-70 family)
MVSPMHRGLGRWNGYIEHARIVSGALTVYRRLGRRSYFETIWLLSGLLSVERDVIEGPSGDLDLWELASAGDQGAFRAIYERHAGSVFRYAFSITRSSPSAADCTQETWTALWVARRRVHIEGKSLLPWLLVTVRHKALRVIARERREIATTAEDMEPRRTTSLDTPSTSELNSLLEKEINKLSDLERRIFDLCVISDLSYEAAATDLGVTSGTIRNRLSRAKKRLRINLTADMGA